MKISVIGTGMVGASFAYRLLIGGIASEIALIDINATRAEGESLDLLHAMAAESSTKVYAADFSGAKDSDIVVITAGLPRKDGETRLDLINKNLRIFKEMIPNITKHAPNAFYVLISNPVDVMTLATIRYGNLDPKKVLGTGTMLDTMRFRAIVAQEYNVHVDAVEGFVIGEHGDSQVPLFSSTTINGNIIHIDEEKKDMIAQKTKTCGAEIIKKKMATYYGIASGTFAIIKALVAKEKTILSVSSQMQFGTEIICTSLPSIITNFSVTPIHDYTMHTKEKEAFQKSNDVLIEYAKLV